MGVTKINTGLTWAVGAGNPALITALSNWLVKGPVWTKAVTRPAQVKTEKRAQPIGRSWKFKLGTTNMRQVGPASLQAPRRCHGNLKKLMWKVGVTFTFPAHATPKIKP